MHQSRSTDHSHLYRRFFVRVDRVLRRSLGVSETAKAKVDIKPAPEVDPTEPEEEADLPDISDIPNFPDYVPGMFGDASQKPMIFDKDTGKNIHDEL
jgi:hypothetical protein